MKHIKKSSKHLENCKAGGGGMVLPLTFGYGLKLQFVKIRRVFFQTRWKYVMAMISMIIIVSTTLLIRDNQGAFGATYGWVQSGWSGGASTTAVAVHAVNESNWGQYYSKDDEVEVTGGGALTLLGATSNWEETDDADFNAGSSSDVYVSGGDVMLKKPNGASCTSGSECYEDACVDNICGKWISGPCVGFDVYFQDVSNLVAWKTTQTDCNTPQCGLDGGQNGDNLVIDNVIDFSLYPARNACKSLGGRLPSMSELSCIYANMASYNNNFTIDMLNAGTMYWSLAEYSTTEANYITFVNGNSYHVIKNQDHGARCVQDL